VSPSAITGIDTASAQARADSSISEYVATPTSGIANLDALSANPLK
jgi:hypothetical protein